MVKSWLIKKIECAVAAKPYVGIHASGISKKGIILAQGLQQGEKVLDRIHSSNPSGIQYLEINKEYVNAMLRQGKVRGLRLKLESSVMALMRMARRHRDREAVIFIFNSAKAKQQNPHNTAILNPRTFREVKLLDTPERPAHIAASELTPISISADEAQEILRKMALRRAATKNPSKVFGGTLAHRKREYARRLVRKILQYYSTK
ncbi:MAG TPA: hypothetical protein HA254_06715 [Candidatus Diapherotrites archaeon]|uniref:Uncharacterized protein n=1 Tax=Candidatus Iainarchaeum sp. TaxID=3101447 RepID=A0A7J4J531_9ARCH|nr:hypothetical protein [Candidatus Diapherotrites archaeon]